MEKPSDELQTAINLAVWLIEDGEAEKALALLMQYYDENLKRDDERDNC
mgnify:CR=1 FL=1